MSQPVPPMRCPPTMHRLATRCCFSGVLVRHWLVTMASATTSTSPASSFRRLAKTTTQCFNSPVSCNTSSPPTFAQSRRAIAGAVASKPYLSSKPSPWATPPSRRSRDGLPERSSSTSQAYDGYPTLRSLACSDNRSRRALDPRSVDRVCCARSQPFLALKRRCLYGLLTCRESGAFRT